MMSTASPSPASPSAPKKKGERSAWTKEQVEALKTAVAAFEAAHPGGAGRGKWKAIAANVPDRNDAQCRQRWEDSTKDGRKEGTWSSTEDMALRLAVESTKNVTWRRWTMVAERIPSRTAKQCEYRYKNHLAPKSGSGRMADQHAGLGLMAEATMSQQKLRSLNPALQSSNGSQSFLVPAPMPPYVDVNTKESLMSAIQTLQPLLTKQAVSAYPSHILDLAVQCIAALPAETSAVVAEVQKLRYVLANQVQINMAPSMMPMYAPVPSYASAPITSKPPPHSQNWGAFSYPTRPSEMPMAGYATMGHTAHPTATNAGFGTDNMPRPSVPYGMARTTNPSSTEGMTAMTQTSTMASPSELPLRDAARSHVGMDQVVSFTSSTQPSGAEATLPLHTTLTTSTTALSDLPRSMASTSKDWDQPASFGSSASGIQSMAAITLASTAT